MANKKKMINLLMIVLAVVLVGYVVSLIIPVFWVLMTTVKSVAEYELYGLGEANVERIGNTLWLPHAFTLKNYVIAYKYFYVLVEGKDGGYDMRYNIFQQFT